MHSHQLDTLLFISRLLHSVTECDVLRVRPAHHTRTRLRFQRCCLVAAISESHCVQRFLLTMHSCRVVCRFVRVGCALLDPDHAIATLSVAPIDVIRQTLRTPFVTAIDHATGIDWSIYQLRARCTRHASSAGIP